MKRLITCAECGKTFCTDAPNQLYCSSTCRDNANTTTCLHCDKLFIAHDSLSIFCSRKCYAEYRRRKHKVNVKHQDKSLSEWVREAQECNLDYGTYRGLIELGKSFEELKAQAALRNLPAHNHAPYGFLSRQQFF